MLKKWSVSEDYLYVEKELYDFSSEDMFENKLINPT